MPELIKTLEAFHKRREQEMKFQASLQGANFNEDEPETKTFDDIKRKALGIEANGDDIVSLQGAFAQEAGFGIGAGLGYSKE
mgnify:FL=1